MAEPLKAHFVAEPIELPDGRRIRVSAYPDGSIRFSVDGLPYVLTEAYLSGNPAKDKALLKLSPGKQGSNAAHNYVEQLEAKQRGQPGDAPPKPNSLPSGSW